MVPSPHREFCDWEIQTAPSPQPCSFPALISSAETLPDRVKKKNLSFFLPLGIQERLPTLCAGKSLSAINHWILN